MSETLQKAQDTDNEHEKHDYNDEQQELLLALDPHRCIRMSSSFLFLPQRHSVYKLVEPQYIRSCNFYSGRAARDYDPREYIVHYDTIYNDVGSNEQPEGRAKLLQRTQQQEHEGQLYGRWEIEWVEESATDDIPLTPIMRWVHEGPAENVFQ